MGLSYDVAAAAQNDLFEIWRHIVADSEDLANRINGEFYKLFAALGQTPGMGHTRKDLTRRHLRFFPLYSFLVVYSAQHQADSHHCGASGQARRETDFTRETLALAVKAHFKLIV